MAKKQRVKKVARHKKPQRAKAFYGGLGEGALKAGYEFAKQQGFEGTYNEWLQSLGANAGGNYTYIPGGNTKDPDIIIDDGSHRIHDQVNSFNLLKERMNPGGIYIIEDIQCLDLEEIELEELHDNVEIIDLRKVKNRYDDVLVVYRF